MHPRPARSLAPLPSLNGFAEAAADPGDSGATPARLQSVIRVLAEATRALLAERLGSAPADGESAPAPRHATS